MINVFHLITSCITGPSLNLISQDNQKWTILYDNTFSLPFVFTLNNDLSFSPSLQSIESINFRKLVIRTITSCLNGHCILDAIVLYSKFRMVHFALVFQHKMCRSSLHTDSHFLSSLFSKQLISNQHVRWDSFSLDFHMCIAFKI